MKEKLIDFFITIIVALVLSTGMGLITTMGVCFLKDFIPMILQLPLFIKWSFGVGFIIAFIYYLYKMIKNRMC